MFLLVLSLINYIRTTSYFNRKIFKQHRWSRANNYNDHKVAKYTNLRLLDVIILKKKTSFNLGGWGEGKAPLMIVCWLENSKITLISQNLVITPNSWLLRWVCVRVSILIYYKFSLFRGTLNFLNPKCVFQRQNYWVLLLQHLKYVWYVYMSQSESGRY